MKLFTTRILTVLPIALALACSNYPVVLAQTFDGSAVSAATPGVNGSATAAATPAVNGSATPSAASSADGSTIPAAAPVISTPPTPPPSPTTNTSPPLDPAERFVNYINDNAEKELGKVGAKLGGATFTGLVDGYIAYDFNAPASDTTGLRLFDPHANRFAFNLSEFGLAKTPTSKSPLGYDVTFGYGDAMKVVNAGNPGALQYVKEAFASYLLPVGKGLQVDAGKFVTPNGLEVIESNADWNYSRSMLFNYAIPFYHFGMRAKYTFNDKYSLTGFVVDGWNNITSGFVSGLHTGALSFAWNVNKKVSITETWMGGPGPTPQDGGHWRNLIDSIVSYTPTAKLSLAVWGDYGRNQGTILSNLPVDWWGAAGYLKYQLDPHYAVATRYEYYNDPDGFSIGGFNDGIFTPAPKQHIQAVTATLERQITQHVIARAEFRHDLSSAPFFQEGAANKLVTGQSTVAAGLMFVLSPPPVK